MVIAPVVHLSPGVPHDDQRSCNLYGVCDDRKHIRFSNWPSCSVHTALELWKQHFALADISMTYISADDTGQGNGCEEIHKGFMELAIVNVANGRDTDVHVIHTIMEEEGLDAYRQCS